jgi:hypothetical protein
MNEIKIDGFIENGLLNIPDKNGLSHMISLMNDMKVEIIIRKKRVLRSLPQNAYYWSVIIPAIQNEIKNLGERLTLKETESWIMDYLLSTDSDFVHSFLKQKFIDKMQVDESTGEVIEIKNPSTKRMNKEEFSDYLNRVIQFANETLQIYIPSPNEN